MTTPKSVGRPRKNPVQSEPKEVQSVDPEPQEIPLSHVGFMRAVYVPGHIRGNFSEWDNVNARNQPVKAYKTADGVVLKCKNMCINIPLSNIAYYIKDGG